MRFGEYFPRRIFLEIMGWDLYNLPFPACDEGATWSVGGRKTIKYVTDANVAQR